MLQNRTCIRGRSYCPHIDTSFNANELRGQYQVYNVQVHGPQKPQKKRVVITFFLLVDFKNGFVSMKGCRKRGLPLGYHYFLPKIDRVLM